MPGTQFPVSVEFCLENYGRCELLMFVLTSMLILGKIMSAMMGSAY